ncbi:MAG: hypothetical protein IJX26_00350 [Clostridia bacterium]|nr:hypothetical protein [Clostridia bacterium]
MKKFFTSLLAFVLICSSAIMFSACKDKSSSGPATITFKEGVYSSSLIEDSVEFNENLTDEEHEMFMEYVNSTAFDPIVDDENLYDNIIANIADYVQWFYLEIHENKVTTYTVVVEDNEYIQTKISIGNYKFKNNELNFGSDMETEYNIVENEDNTLTLTTEEYFVTGYENYYNVNYKKAYSYKVLLTPSTPENPVAVPTPESVFYANKTIAKHYRLVSLDAEGIYEDDADILSMSGIDSEEELVDLIKKYANGEIILFTDGTVYYEMNADMTTVTEALMNESIPSSLRDMMDTKIRIGYMYQYRVSEDILDAYDIY